MTTTNMEYFATVLGALSAGKMPTQSQMNSWIDWTVRHIDGFSNVAEDPSGGRLSEHGRKLTEDFKQVLLAHKELGSKKNGKVAFISSGDDLLQTALYDLSHGELQADPSLQQSQREAMEDAEQASNALREVFMIVLHHLTSTSSGMGDFASFIRTFLADTAEVVEQHAGTVKSELRQTEAEVQEGKRDALGRENREDYQSDDARQRFERNMDTVKAAGSNVIGGAQAVKESGDQLGDKVSHDLDNLVENILINCENDENYRKAVLTVFDITSKWLNKSLDSSEKNSIQDIIDDPTGRVSNALKCLNTLMERLASKSSDDLLNALRATIRDIKEDPELHKYFDDLHDFMRRSLVEPTYVRSEEHERHRKDLNERWKRLQSGEQHRKWHDDVDRLRREYREFFTRIENDTDVRRLHEASLVFGKDFVEAAATLQEVALGHANWLWQDISDVYLPRLIEKLQGIPIPRTEYKDDTTEFVMEDLLIETLKLLPGHVQIHNATDMDFHKSSAGSDTRANIKSYTRLHFKGVQFHARDVSFWYNDTTLRPVTEISGLLGVVIPPEGLEIDVALTLLPQPKKKDAHKAQRHAFFKVENVNVNLNSPEFTISKSNHSILFTAFKPIVRSRIEKAIETSLGQQIALSIEMLDNVLFDTHQRAGVFADTGMPLSASYLSAVWSEIGHLKKQPGLFSGLRTTSVGVIKDDPRQESTVAIGAQPQIISGDKHGPSAPGSDSQKKRDEAVRLARESKGVAKGIGERAQSGVVSFAQEVQIKRDQEMHKEGWKSNAFDVRVLSR
ncbi:hypothetical protein Clacol_007597 [Clathrus columnatus]|uniref:Uncharacterized protein n=1 Tax=Clathrus columnatus TaxID=1419009 RepID=A0AAV5AN51_9AGAM|nr:hypothetical protein Clacol_007597 [Clathrus columnatus]